MKYLLTILFFFIIGAVKAQYIPNASAYSYKGVLTRQSLQPPQGCGQPITGIHAPDPTQAAFYWDSCADQLYTFSPKQQLWLTAQSGIDSIFITSTDSIFIITSSNDTIYIGNNGGGIQAFEKNITQDSIILTLSDGTRFAVKDSTGSGGTSTPELQPHTPGYGILGSTYNGTSPQTWSLDTSVLNDAIFIDSSETEFFVDSIANTPLGTEANGIKYLVGTSPTGAFAGHQNQIATLIGGVWTFVMPDDGDDLVVSNDSEPTAFYHFNGTSWHLVKRSLSIGGDRIGARIDIGTMDNQSLRFLVNGTYREQISSAGHYFRQFVGVRSNNYIRVTDTATGRIDTASFTPLQLTTTGTSGPSTLVNDVLNIPVYSSGSSGGGGIHAVYAGTGLTKVNDSTLSLTTPVAIANGGTGTATPSLIGSSHISITGSWPNQTITSTGGGNISGTLTPLKLAYSIDANTIRADSAYSVDTSTGGITLLPILKGTVSVSAGSPTVTGVGTFFTSVTKRGDSITINGETRVVLSITNNTTLTTATNFTNAASTQLYQINRSKGFGTRFLANGNIIQTTLGGTAGVFIGEFPSGSVSIGTANPNIGINNVGVGWSTMPNATTAQSGSVAIGNNAGERGSQGTWVGAFARGGSGTGQTIIGYSSGGGAAGAFSTIVGNAAATSSTGANTVFGDRSFNALADGTTPITTATNNLALGAQIRAFAVNETNSITIGNSALSNGSNTTTIGTTSTTDAYINGTLRSTGRIVAFAAKTSAYTATAKDEVITGDATGGAFNVTLPTAVGRSGQQYTVKKIDASANAVTVNTTSSQNIDAATTYALSTQYKFVTVVSNGTQWYVISNN